MVEAVVLSLIALAVAAALLLLTKPFLNLQFARVLHWDMESNTAVYGML
jgi:hypothetical protein